MSTNSSPLLPEILFIRSALFMLGKKVCVREIIVEGEKSILFWIDGKGRKRGQNIRERIRNCIGYISVRLAGLKAAAKIRGLNSVLNEVHTLLVFSPTVFEEHEAVSPDIKIIQSYPLMPGSMWIGVLMGALFIIFGWETFIRTLESLCIGWGIAFAVGFCTDFILKKK
jgi:hypothetical protein